MKKALKIVGWILLILIIIALVGWFGFFKPAPPPISTEDRTNVTLMPLPAELKLGTEFFILEESLSHKFTGLSSLRLERAVERFYNRLSTHTALNYGSGNQKFLILKCSGSEMEYPALGDDESYSIKVTPQKIVVKAATETGIIYGLESLFQLVREENGTWILPQLSLKDHPRYPWRGLMIDACRHWIPKEVIIRNLEAMGALKMNVFHWHLTEYQGFRVESKVYPGLHELGSGGDYYTQDEIREVVEFAADRGIRVLPEFDLPGHSTSWFIGYPELASAPGPYVLDTIFGILDPVMDPTRDEVYDFLDRFFEEMSTLFPDQIMHIGGDEVHDAHWNENPQIQSFIKENDLKDSHDLQAYFNIRLQKLLAGHGKFMMGWDEIIHPDLPQEGIVVQTWRDHSSLWESARKGNKAVLSAGYYLDYKQPAGFHYQIDPAVIQGAVNIEIDSLNWKSWDCSLQISDADMDGALYLFGEGDSLKGSGKIAIMNLQMDGHRSGGSDMAEGKALPEFKTLEPLTSEQEANLLGGEACMWSEMVDGTTMESRIWPRAAAVAEKLWSPGVLTSETEDMYRRLWILDERLEQLGLQHRNYSQALLREMVPFSFLEPLNTLASLLQEDKFFMRMQLYDPQLYTYTPLNRMVDASLPESYQAYQFEKDVDLWIETQDPEVRERLIAHFEAWQVNYEKLAPAFENSIRLSEVETHSRHLSALSELGLESISNPAALEGKTEEVEALFSAAGVAYGGTVLAVVEAVQKLVSSASGN